MRVFNRNWQTLIRNGCGDILKRTIGFKSNISLENLYPSSSLKLTTPEQLPYKRHEKFSGYIPTDELNITYSKSSGPGGQNVNKVNTKVEVRFHLQSAKWLSDEVKSKLLEKLKPKLTKEGYLIYKSDITRYQQLNLADCLEKIRSSICQNLVEQPEPSPESLEKARRRAERAARERLMLKRQRSLTKQNRRGIEDVL